MSSIASMYVFTTEQIKELNKIARQLPRRAPVPEGAHVMLCSVAPEDVKAATAPYEPFWDYIHDNGDDNEFDLNWNGEMMDRALLYLREKDIDLTKAPLIETGDDEFAFLVYNTEYKNKYLEKLDPNNFDQNELNEWLEEYMWGTPQEGIMDAIRNIHIFFQQIDDTHVVLLHTDWIAGVIQSKPLGEQPPGFKQPRMIVYLCKDCGSRMDNSGGYNRISDAPKDTNYRCWTQFLITTKVVDGKEIEESKDVTMPSMDDEADDHRCKEIASGCYRAVL